MSYIAGRKTQRHDLKHYDYLSYKPLLVGKEDWQTLNLP